MNFLDVLLGVRGDIVSVVPIFPAQTCENSKWRQLMRLTHIHAHVDVAANDSLSHTIDDSHL